MLPETIQTILFTIAGMSIYAIPYWLSVGLQNFTLIVIIIEVILIIILAQKNFVFRRISKIENAISFLQKDAQVFTDRFASPESYESNSRGKPSKYLLQNIMFYKKMDYVKNTVR